MASNEKGPGFLSARESEQKTGREREEERRQATERDRQKEGSALSPCDKSRCVRLLSVEEGKRGAAGEGGRTDGRRRDISTFKSHLVNVKTLLISRVKCRGTFQEK